MTDQGFPTAWQSAAPNDGAVNQTEIRVVGMSRSGNHAILQWLMHQLHGRTAFLNCVEPKTNPFASARPLGDGRRAVANYPQFDLEAEQRGRLTPKDTLIYSYEDVFLGAVTAPDFERQRPAWLGTSRRRIDILILRDPFNLFASRRRGGFYRGSGREPADTVTERTALRIWKQHAREALGERRHLHPERVVIRYNEWAAHREARRALARRLNLRFDDAAASRVPDTGGGSSFDGTTADGAPGRMAVTERWRHFAGQASFRALFDGETRTLARRLFGAVAEGLHGPLGETG